MPNLIPFAPHAIGTEEVEAVNARDLHAFLGVKTEFAQWMSRRIHTYGFLQGVDYMDAISGDGPTKTIEYFITMDMAKQLAMVERNAKGREARLYFIACEKMLLSHQASSQVPPSRTEELDYLRNHVAFLTDLGMCEHRDRLMLADMARNLLTSGALLPLVVPGEQSPPSMPFFVADRVRALGYHLTRKQEASLMPGLGRRIKAEYRTRYGEDPHQSSRFVDGAVRPVYVYSTQDAEWIDVMAQAALAEIGAQR